MPNNTAEHHSCFKQSHQQTDRLEPTHWGQAWGGVKEWKTCQDLLMKRYDSKDG